MNFLPHVEARSMAATTEAEVWAHVHVFVRKKRAERYKRSKCFAESRDISLKISITLVPKSTGIVPLPLG